MSRTKTPADQRLDATRFEPTKFEARREPEFVDLAKFGRLDRSRHDLC
jgi:hypothetical protein